MSVGVQERVLADGAEDHDVGDDDDDGGGAVAQHPEPLFVELAPTEAHLTLRVLKHQALFAHFRPEIKDWNFVHILQSRSHILINEWSH